MAGGTFSRPGMALRLSLVNDGEEAAGYPGRTPIGNDRFRGASLSLRIFTEPEPAEGRRLRPLTEIGRQRAPERIPGVLAGSETTHTSIAPEDSNDGIPCFYPCSRAYLGPSPRRDQKA